LLLNPEFGREQTLAGLLERMGYEVRTASDCEICLVEAGPFDPHLVIVDAALAVQHRLVHRLRVEQGMERVFFVLLDTGVAKTSTA
jgi:DNA-binding response OmpR family regulator